jgi:transcriptional regulator with XRE-family HTH domain
MNDLVSPFELKLLRQSLGASLSKMAQLLGLSGSNDADTVRKMETGNKVISGPIQRLIKSMQGGVPTGVMKDALPEYLIGSDLENEKEPEWIFHTRYPRFLAVVAGAPVDSMMCVAVDDEWINVALWIDEPIDDPSPYIHRAAEAFAQYTDSSAYETSPLTSWVESCKWMESGKRDV